MERELARFEREMDALGERLSLSGDDLEDQVEEILDEAIEKGLARRIE